MSATIVFGFFALAGGKHVKTVKSGSTATTYHCLYKMTVQCTSGIVFPVSLHIYSPFNNVMLPDNTIAFVVAKASVPVSVPHDPVLLEAFLMIPVPGDPSLDGYEQAVPDTPHPMVVGLGAVTSAPWILANGTSRSWSSCLIMLGMLGWSLHCVFDASCTHWSKTPVPHLNSVVLYIGQFSDVAVDGGLHVDLESITMNVSMVEGRQGESSSASVSRKCKFLAAVPDDHSPLDLEAIVSDVTGSSLVKEGLVTTSSVTANPGQHPSSPLSCPNSPSVAATTDMVPGTRGKGKNMYL
ncbi:hypothetical protein EDD16DRAFT_1718025 [Pisolithus croceorrhizus]|nr:hypothetical protein EDD16DRAFT_1718025 [Pisolithus croceorrhizus]KAI6111609.1 hypothetical protein EV401DRAFT_2075327 [Pisolithus croceorrhizus]KAI6167252.1 hypothetical protein EDD17DRAFT_1751811 [Pisolithus thermaeus]